MMADWLGQLSVTDTLFATWGGWLAGSLVLSVMALFRPGPKRQPAKKRRRRRKGRG